MSTVKSRRSERAQHSSTSEMSRKAAITLWRNATESEKRKQAAIAILASAIGYKELTEMVGTDDARKIYTDAGKDIPV